VVAIPTRYGDVTVTRDDPGCCGINIRYGNQVAEIASTNQIYASLEGVYKVKEGDLVVISSTSRARGSPPRHYVLLVDQEGMTDLTGPDFATSDGTFKATQPDGEVHFDLGSQKRKKKSAICKNGTVTVDIRSPELEATLPKKECAAILNMVVKCVRLPECNEGRIFDTFAMAALRYFNRLEEMPVFTSRNFYTVCTAICTSKSYVAKRGSQHTLRILGYSGRLFPQSCFPVTHDQHPDHELGINRRPANIAVEGCQFLA
jgi:hypothetical protein